MALNAAQQWWVRTGGDETNGAGYDSTISGAGTNYSDQDAAQLALTDVVTTGTTSVTSVTGGFTTAMIGNIIRIESDGYYAILARVSTNAITVDRATGSGTGQSVKIGGAKQGVINFANGGTGSQPTLATPLAPGHTVNIRGRVAGVSDYLYLGATYWTYPNGDTTNGPVTFQGYGPSPPQISVNGLFLFNGSYYRWTNGIFVLNAANNAALGILHGSNNQVDGCSFDASGFDIVAALSTHFYDNTCLNTGAAGAGVFPAWNSTAFAGYFSGNFIKGWQGPGAAVVASAMSQLRNSIIAGVGASGVTIAGASAQLTVCLDGLTIDSCVGDAITVDTPQSLQGVTGRNLILSNNGGYAWNILTGSQAVNDRMAAGRIDYNNYFNNTSGPRNALSAGPHDLALDPQYTNPSANDYTIGTNLAAKGFPNTFPT